MKEEIKAAISALIKKAIEAPTGADAQGYAGAAQTLTYVLQQISSPPQALL